MSRPAYEEVQKLHSGARFVVTRARRADGASVIIERVSSDRPELCCADRLKHEYELLRILDVPGAPRPLDLTLLDGRSALVLADAGPRNLADVLADGPLAIDRFLELALLMSGGRSGGSRSWRDPPRHLPGQLRPRR